MIIQALFFGATADIVGVRSKSIESENSVTTPQIVDQIVLEFPDLRRHKLLFSVNQEYVSGDVTVKDGDELAIFTAVSGG